MSLHEAYEEMAHFKTTDCPSPFAVNVMVNVSFDTTNLYPSDVQAKSHPHRGTRGGG